MTKKNNLLIISLLLTIAVFIYLTQHHFSVKMGIGGSTVCSINEKFNCDAAASSSYSEVMGVPVAILGAIFNLFLFGLVVFIRLGWVENSPYALGTTRFMLGLGAVTSVLMGLISIFFVRVVCPFCLASYVLSIFNLILGWSLFETSDKFDFKQLFGPQKSYLIFLISIPVVAWMISGMMQESNGLAQVKKLAPEKIQQWLANPVNTFNTDEGLVRAGTDKKIILVEFADFKCPHCKSASTVIDSFLKGHPEVHFVFKPFPLDGSCNKAIQSKGDSSRCALAGWVLCAEKNEKRGWDVHHWIFDKQSSLFETSDLTQTLAQLGKDLNINTEKLKTCGESTETYQQIEKLAEEGKNAKVEGTPTIYMNGKKLPYGQFLDVLQSAAATVK